MTTNTKMTVYKKVFDITDRKNKWVRQNPIDVMWQGGKGASVNKGYENANDVRIFVPKPCNITFNIGDIVVKGEYVQNINTQQDLVGEVYNLTTIIDHDYGTLTHIELGGK